MRPMNPNPLKLEYVCFKFSNGRPMERHNKPVERTHAQFLIQMEREYHDNLDRIDHISVGVTTPRTAYDDQPTPMGFKTELTLEENIRLHQQALGDPV